MKPLLALALLLPACAQLGLAKGKIDAAAAVQNLANVTQLAEENTRYVTADATLAQSLKAAAIDRNAAAVTLARKIAENAK